MPLSFLPRVMTQKLTDLTPDYLRQNGIRLLMLDFDNTMLPYTAKEPTQELLMWIDRMKRGGITLFVVSNSRKTKALDFCRAHNIGCVNRSKKR